MSQRALSKHSESTQKTLREFLKSTQREREQSDFVIPSEPKILRLVSYESEKEFFFLRRDLLKRVRKVKKKRIENLLMS